MRQLDAEDILDIATSGTSATLLAKRWESALLVNVDNETLKRLMERETRPLQWRERVSRKFAPLAALDKRTCASYVRVSRTKASTSRI